MKIKKNSTTEKQMSTKTFYLYPIILIIAILPFIMRYHVYNTGLEQFTWSPPNQEHFDIFLYYKQITFIFTSIIMFLCICYELCTKKKKINFNLTLFFLFLYGLLSLLSTLFSDYKNFGFTGIFDQFESVFVLLGYCITVFYIFIFIKDSFAIEKLFKCLTISILILSIIGISQITGNNFFATDIGLKTFLPSYVWPYKDEFTFTFDNTVFLTLFNPNYVGVYTGLLLPIYISLSITHKKNKQYLLILLSIIGLIICLIGSGSEAGVIGVMISIIFIIIFYRKYIFINKVTTFTFLSLALIACWLLLINTPNKILSNLMPKKQVLSLTDIKTEENIEITYNNNILIFDYIIDDNGLSILINDQFNNVISSHFEEESTSFLITDERFNNMRIKPYINDDILYFDITINSIAWTFTKYADDTFYYINSYGKMDKITSAPAAFNGFDTFASGRGYIWSKTIPLLKNYLFIGSGADTFALVFPQQDYVHLYNNGFSEQILTKPHSLYLQIGVQTGVLSLILFILIYIIYFISSVRYYYNANLSEPLYMYGCAIFIGTISYMIIGLANDSTITVSPIYWTLLGLGITINEKIKYNNSIN